MLVAAIVGGFFIWWLFSEGGAGDIDGGGMADVNARIERARTANERQKLINELRAASGGLNASNNNLKAELERLKMLQIEQRRSLTQTEQALKESERSLIRWKKEELKKRTSLERKKRAWQIIAVAAVIAAAVK